MSALIIFLTFILNGVLQQAYSHQSLTARSEDTSPSQTCGTSLPKCTNSKYRSIDGSCNNINQPTWGMTETPYGRLTPFNYADGKSALPTAASGNPLPNVREISLKLFPDIPLIDLKYNLNTQQWGQIIVHDMSLASQTTQTGKDPIDCCDDNGQLTSSSNTNPACAPILIPRDDPYHAPQGIQCMKFVRTTKDHKCPPPAQPITSVTAYMDLSIVYGSDAAKAASIRTKEGGKLLWTERNGRTWPPQDPNATSTCPGQMSNKPCYLAGDIRVNQNPHLTILQIILFREHNRIADVLARLNPHWNDETIYQEARRILIAVIQHINYNEYLTILLGTKHMIEKKLIHPEASGYVNDYNASVNPSVLDEHATAANRYFHTLIRGHLKLLSENRVLLKIVRLSDWFNKPSLLEDDNTFDKLTRGLTAQSMGCSDRYMDSEVTEYLFKGNRTYGDDLRAIDIQRGRDHGLPTYTKARANCGLTVPKNFHEMKDYIPKNSLNILKTLYEAPEDVDLLVGGALERHVHGALVGPTFLCILTEQFYRTRVGDRYFYENGADSETAFTLVQLKVIRSGASMARVLCDNADGIHSMQPQAFRLISADNKLTSCNEIPRIDLSLWKEASGENTNKSDTKKEKQ